MDRRKRHRKAKTQRKERRAREAREEFRASVASNLWSTRDAVRMLADARAAWRDVRADSPPQTALERVQALMLAVSRESRNEGIFALHSALAPSWDESTPRVWRLAGTPYAVARGERRMVEIREYRADGKHVCEHTGEQFALLSLPADISPSSAKRALVYLTRAGYASTHLAALPTGLDAGHVPEISALPYDVQGANNAAQAAPCKRADAEWSALQKRHDGKKQW